MIGGRVHNARNSAVRATRGFDVCPDPLNIPRIESRVQTRETRDLRRDATNKDHNVGEPSNCWEKPQGDADGGQGIDISSRGEYLLDHRERGFLVSEGFLKGSGHPKTQDSDKRSYDSSVFSRRDDGCHCCSGDISLRRINLQGCSVCNRSSIPKHDLDLAHLDCFGQVLQLHFHSQATVCVRTCGRAEIHPQCASREVRVLETDCLESTSRPRKLNGDGDGLLLGKDSAQHNKRGRNVQKQICSLCRRVSNRSNGHLCRTHNESICGRHHSAKVPNAYANLSAFCRISTCRGAVNELGLVVIDVHVVRCPSVSLTSRCIDLN
mmetsp:Transcript_33432/g.78868  ORF Transcript_33432/g.78868 Transcript_33432/m.78868 type:complete len:323 (-) Transcript_33432:2404-3372(-)